MRVGVLVNPNFIKLESISCSKSTIIMMHFLLWHHLKITFVQEAHQNLLFSIAYCATAVPYIVSYLITNFLHRY